MWPRATPTVCTLIIWFVWSYSYIWQCDFSFIHLQVTFNTDMNILLVGIDEW